MVDIISICFKYILITLISFLALFGLTGGFWSKPKDNKKLLAKKVDMIARKLGSYRHPISYVYKDMKVWITLYTDNLSTDYKAFYVFIMEPYPLLVFQNTFDRKSNKYICEVYHAGEEWEQHINHLIKVVYEKQINNFKDLEEIL